MRQTKPLSERFWAKVTKSDGCWEWQGGHYRSGYGTIKSTRPQYAHRVSWELTNGPIPNGMHVCHHCDNRNCVRPDHLFLGTNADNHRDRQEKGRSAKKLTPVTVRAIRYVFPMFGLTKAEIGRAVGVDESMIGRVLDRRAWSHL